MVSSGEVLAGLFAQHYVALVRLAVVLLQDLAAAEEVVQDAFVAMHGRRPEKSGQGIRLSAPRRGKRVKVSAAPPHG